MKQIACIDIGTVTVRLGIFDIDSKPIKVVKKLSTICDLGKGFNETGNLSKDAIERVLSCIDTYVAIIKSMDVVGVCCVLTAAARESHNVSPLLDGLSSKGLIAQVIGGKTEGCLTFLGICQDFPNQRILAVDNGGGSTELTVGRLAEEEELSYRPTNDAKPTHHMLPVVERVMSIGIGCRRLSDSYNLYSGIPTAETIEQAREFVRNSFAGAVDEEGILMLEPQKMIACGGTVTSLVAMLHELEPYDPAFVHLHALTFDEIEGLIARMSKLDLDGLKALPGLQEKRADVIFGGALILSELMKCAGFKELTVSEHDLLVGLGICAAAEYHNDYVPLPWKPGLARL